MTLSISGWRPYFIIAVLAFTAYAPTLTLGFLWDDHVIIEHNPYLQSWTWPHVKHDFVSDNTQGQGDNYFRPFQTFSHRVDYSVWGLNPLGYHLNDLLVHVANGFLLYLLVMALGFNAFVALMTASLFVVNPIAIEQFIISSGRTTPLSFFFSLACILCLIREDLIWTVLGYLSFGLALLTKEISTITPALLACVLYVRKAPLRQWWVLIPMLPMTAGYFLLRENAVHSVIGPMEMPLFLLFMTKVFARIVWHYIFLILWPWNLHSHRLIPHLSHLWWIYLVGLGGVTLWAILKNRRIGLFCLGWVVIGLLPTIPIMIRGYFMLDHWGYPIALGVLLPLSWILYQGWVSRDTRVRVLSFGLYAVLLIAWSLLTHLNVALRGTDEKMYRWALHFTTSHPIKYNLGVLLIETNRPREALYYLEEVREAYPDDSNNVNALALAYVKTGNPWMARRILETFARIHPDDTLTQDHLRLLKVPKKRR